MTEDKYIKCYKCDGLGRVKAGAVFTGMTSSCKSCGFQALGMTQVRQFEKRGDLCRQCSGDYGY